MITVNELFSGIGAQSAALERLGIDFKVVGIAEIDKYAIKSYEAIHGPARNYGDISKIEKLDYADFWTYSFPCQDISVAGKQRGINENTRSGLLYQVERLLEVSKECDELPKYLMLENVKNLVGKKFKQQFDEWIKRLDELGYNTYWQVLNAKNYGIPQNRERVFAISIRKDIDSGYEFPKGFDNGKRVKDILETEVDEKYYLSSKMIDYVSSSGTGGFYYKPEFNPDIAKPITASVAKMQRAGCANYITENEINQVGMLNIKGNEQIRRVYDESGISPTLNTMQGENKQPKVLCVGNTNPSGHGMNGNIFDSDGSAPTLTTNKGEGNKVLIPQATKQGYIECKVGGVADLSFPSSETRRGRVQDSGDICPTLMAGQQDICYIEPNVLEPKLEFGRMGRQAVETYNENQPRYGSTINPFNKTVDDSENSPTLTTRPEGFKTAILPVTNDFRIRKLTPLECWRLMGFTDEQFHKAEKFNSNSQLYKQAGNSIVVDVLYHIFNKLFIDKSVCETSKIEPNELQGQMTIRDFLVS